MVRWAAQTGLRVLFLKTEDDWMGLGDSAEVTSADVLPGGPGLIASARVMSHNSVTPGPRYLMPSSGP